MYIIIGILAGIIILQSNYYMEISAAGERHLPPVGVPYET